MISVADNKIAEGISTELVSKQLVLLINHRAFKSSKRLIAFLEFVVGQAIEGSADRIKERTIGVEVFDRKPDYDTSTDHIVRTAASELRKRLAAYYGEDAHRMELHIDIPQGSYIPRFTLPQPVPTLEKLPVRTENVLPVNTPSDGHELARHGRQRSWLVSILVLLIIFAVATASLVRRSGTPQSRFWKPVIKNSSSVLLVAGNVSNGPPKTTYEGIDVTPSPPPNSEFGFPSVAFGDAVAMSRMGNFLETKGKTVEMRQESAVSFDDLRAKPSVLIGLFNNAWSLRLARPLRFSLAMDAQQHLIYIRDRVNPASRTWSVVATDRVGAMEARASGRSTIDYALISRIVNSETGTPVVIVGGLYMYGTKAAGDFLADQNLEGLASSIPLDSDQKNLQIILQTSVTEGVPGPPKVVAYSQE
jgi:hypothetical protein